VFEGKVERQGQDSCDRDDDEPGSKNAVTMKMEHTLEFLTTGLVFNVS
jgi:hypothetical protein